MLLRENEFEPKEEAFTSSTKTTLYPLEFLRYTSGFIYKDVDNYVNVHKFIT